MAIIDNIDQDLVVKAVSMFWVDQKLARKDKERAWMDATNNYLTIIDESNYENWPWRSKAADTFSQEIGDSISAALGSALFPITEEYYDLEGGDKAGEVLNQDMKKVMDGYLYDSNFIEKVQPWLKQIAVIGNAPVLLPWDRIISTKKKRRYKVNPESGKNEIEIADVTEVKKDIFDFVTLDAFDVVVDGDNPDTSTSPIVRRVVTSHAKLMEMSDIYENLDQLAETSKPSEGDSEADKRARASAFGYKYQEQNDGIERLEAYYPEIEIGGKIYRDMVITVANQKTLLRFEENPFWGGRPIHWGTYDRVWFSPYGRGPLEPLLMQQELINTFINQKVDILNLIINGCFAYVDDGIIDVENLLLRPRGGIEVGDINNIKELHPSNNVGLAFNEIDSIRTRGERSSGASSFSSGGVKPGKRTAFESNLIQQGSNNRFNNVTRHLANDFFEYVLNFYVQSVKQFKFGLDDLPDEMLMAEYKVRFLGADLSAIKSFELQQFAQLVDIISRSPELSQAINPVELMNEWRRLLGIKNRKIVLTKEEMDEKLKAAQEQQANQEKAGTPQGQVNPDEGMLRENGQIE